jgi:hypothetical protein
MKEIAMLSVAMTIDLHLLSLYSQISLRYLCTEVHNDSIRFKDVYTITAENGVHESP